MSPRDAATGTTRFTAEADLHAAAASPRSSSTGVVSGASERRTAGGGLADQVSSLPAPVRLKMELIARAAGSSEQALEPIIELLVDGSAPKRAAIVNAFRTNEPLREQWERTYEILRG